MLPMDDKRVIIEFIKVGAYVKVSAIDPVSSVEERFDWKVRFLKS